MRRTIVMVLAVLALGAVFAASSGPLATVASAATARMRSSYGYIFMQRDGECTHEELWTGLREVTGGSLSPGSPWSDPVDTAWAWYRHSDTCSREETMLYGERVLLPSEFELARLGDLWFVTDLEMFEASSYEPPPFLLLGPSVSTTSRGVLALDLAFTQEGRIRPFNIINGVLVPPPPHAMGGAPDSVTAWQYTGASVQGSVTGVIGFDLESIVFAEIGRLTTIVM